MEAQLFNLQLELDVCIVPEAVLSLGILNGCY